MKKVIILVIFLTIIVGGAAAGMMVAGYGPFAPKGNAEPEKPVVVEVPPATIEMGALAVPLIMDNTPSAHVQVLVRLIVDPPQEPYVRSQLTRLRSAYLNDLISFLPVHMQTRKVPDATDLHARLKLISDKILGSGVIRDVQVIDARIR